MRKIKRWTALLCAGVMAAAFLTGCGKGKSDDTASQPKQEGKKNTAAAEEENTEKSMGRYLEREMALPEEINEMVPYPIPYIKMLEDGSMMLAEKTAGRYISQDGGETWESDGNPWGKTAGSLYVTDIAISPAGAVAMLGIPTDGGGTSETEESSEDTSDAEVSSDAQAEEAGGHRRLKFRKIVQRRKTDQTVMPKKQTDHRTLRGKNWTGSTIIMMLTGTRRSWNRNCRGQRSGILPSTVKTGSMVLQATGKLTGSIRKTEVKRNSLQRTG